MSAPLSAQLLGGETSCRDTNGRCSHGACARDIVWRVADDENVSGIDVGQAALPRALDRERHQLVSIRGIVAKRAAAEIPPQIEMLELDPCACLEVARQQAQEHVVAPIKDVEQLADTGHHRLDPAAGAQ